MIRGRFPDPGPAMSKPKNIVICLCDQLRASEVGCYPQVAARRSFLNGTYPDNVVRIFLRDIEVGTRSSNAPDTVRRSAKAQGAS